LRIGYVCAAFPAPSESWIRVEAEALKAAGHEVRICTLDRPKMLTTCEVIVCHFATLAGFANSYAVPYILIPHANDIWPDGGAQLMRAVLTHRNLVAVGCISSYHRERYMEWGVSEDLLVDYPVAVDVKVFSAKAATLDGRERVGCGGRNVPKKGIPLALEAWPDARVFGSRDGWLDPHALADAIDRDVWCWLNASVVDPVTQDQDGLPCMVLEAISAGCRCVSTKVAGLCDLEGLVAFAEPTALSLRKAIENESRDFNFAGMRYVQDRHCPSAVADNVAKIAGERIWL